MYNKVAARFIVCLVLLFQAYAWQIMFSYPFLDLRVTRDSGNQIVLAFINSPSGGKLLGLQVGDHVISVDGQPAEEYWAVRRFRTLEQAETITVSRNGEEITRETKNINNFSQLDVISIIIELLSLIMAYISYKKVRSKSARYIAAIFLCISFIFISIVASVRGEPVGKLFVFSGTMFTPVLFYHFISVFLKEKANIQLSSRALRPIYCLAAGFGAIMTLMLFDTPFTYPVYMFSKAAVMLIGAIGVCANLIILVRVYAVHRNKNQNFQVIAKTLFASLFCSMMPLALLYFVPRLFFGHVWLDPLYCSSFIFILPLTFVYLLATRRLYDVDIIIRRMLFTTVIAIIPSLLFISIIKLTLLHEARNEQLSLLFIVLLLGSSFVLYSLEYLTTKLSPVLFPRKHRLEMALKRVSSELGFISSFSEMKNIVLVDIVQTLGVTGGAIVFQYKDRVETILEGEVEKEQVESLILDHNPPDTDHYVCFEVSRQQEYSSFLVVGPKRTGTQLGLEEVNWLHLIITYLAISLENIQLIRKLDDRIQQLSALLPDEEEAQNLIWFRKLMFELQEKERFRIATDLHDTTMQDLFYLKGRLEIMQEKYSLPQEATAYVRGMADYIDIINKNLRQSCFELNPYLLKEIGLVGTLNKFFQTERAVSSFQISFITSEIVEIEAQNMELKRHLFRVVQELMNNAKKYSYASTVRFSICIQDGVLYFEYMDDGVGFEPSRPVVREIGSSGIGIEQMKSRVLSLQGEYELQAASGQGVRFEAHFPVKLGRSSA